MTWEIIVMYRSNFLCIFRGVCSSKGQNPGAGPELVWQIFLILSIYLLTHFPFFIIPRTSFIIYRLLLSLFVLLLCWILVSLLLLDCKVLKPTFKYSCWDENYGLDLNRNIEFLYFSVSHVFFTVRKESNCT